jgi:hypothetical protein
MPGRVRRMQARPRMHDCAIGESIRPVRGEADSGLALRTPGMIGKYGSTVPPSRLVKECPASTGKTPQILVKPPRRKYFAFSESKTVLMFGPSHPAQGADRESSRNAVWDAVDVAASGAQGVAGRDLS